MIQLYLSELPWYDYLSLGLVKKLVDYVGR